MAISTFAELKTAMANWLDVASGNFASSQLDDLVLLSEKWVMRNIRHPDMESTFSSAIASGVIAAPTGFLGLRHAYVDGSPVKQLQIKSAHQIYAAFPTRSAQAKPSWIAYDAGNLIFGPYPDANYTIKGTYLKTQGPLSSATYNLFTNNPDLFLFAALAEAEMVLGRDERVERWRAKRDEIAMGVNRDAFGIHGGGGMAITTA